MSASGSTAAGLVMIIAGVWLLLQTLVGSLPSRILRLSGSTSSSSRRSPSVRRPGSSSAPVAPATPAASAPASSARTTSPTAPGQGPKVNLGPGSGQSTIPSVGGGPPAPTFG